MSKEQESRPVSRDQLVVEVKGSCAVLVMVEAKCIEVDGKQDDSEPDTTMLKQPETRPIDHDQLVAEANGSQAGLSSQ